MIDLAAELEGLAERIARIRLISNSNPHAFYEERSEVASEIRKPATFRPHADAGCGGGGNLFALI